MTAMRTRRGLPRTFGVGANCFVTGCLSFFDTQGSMAAYEMLVDDSTSETREAELPLTAESQGEVFTHTYRVEPDRLDESKEVTTEAPLEVVSVESPALGATQKPYQSPANGSDSPTIVVLLESSGPEIYFRRSRR